MCQSCCCCFCCCVGALSLDFLIRQLKSSVGLCFGIVCVSVYVRCALWEYESKTFIYLFRLKVFCFLLEFIVIVADLHR